MLVIGEKWGRLLNYFGVIQSYEEKNLFNLIWWKKFSENIEKLWTEIGNMWDVLLVKKLNDLDSIKYVGQNIKPQKM